MTNILAWQVKQFNDLTIHELYDILHLRGKIFIVEQNAPYIDLDYKDQKALHLFAYKNNQLVAYCRLFKRGDYFDEASVGRVIVAEEYRRYGYGHQLMEKAIEMEMSLLNESKITISAQLYLQNFYESHGFERISDVYLEDGLPHVKMVKK
ncbi:MAG: GNAT family N-acetyltransferase [Dysgonomonas sp.]